MFEVSIVWTDNAPSKLKVKKIKAWQALWFITDMEDVRMQVPFTSVRFITIKEVRE